MSHIFIKNYSVPIKVFIALLVFIFSAFPVKASVDLEELWDKYAPEAHKAGTKEALKTPGLVIGKTQGIGESDFSYPWKYRPTTYEMHFENPEDLARAIYALAVFTRDVVPDFPREKFYGAVNGFHYGADQIAEWLNDSVFVGKELSAEESALAGRLLMDGILGIGAKGFMPTGEVTHVIGAAPGKKRQFADNLLHERLHVFWDEDASFKNEGLKAWRNLSDAENSAARNDLKNYNQDNEPQLIEEWTIKRAEKSKMPIK